MAKKKRKHFIKLNNKIKEIFGGRAFDEAVEDIETDTLMELCITTDTKPHSSDRDDLMRCIRRVWSEGDYTIRKAIVDYLLQKYGFKKEKKNSISKNDKVDTILSMISDLDCSRDEEEKILQYFIDIPLSKITLNKIKNRLLYIRLLEQRERVMKIAQANLDEIDRLEFIHSFEFKLSNHSFIKYINIKTEPLNIDTLSKMSDEDILKTIEKLKQNAVEKKSKEIEEFISSIHKHKYLSEDEIEKLIRKAPPEFDIRHLPIDIEIIEKILKVIDSNIYLNESEEHFIIEKDSIYTLYGIDINYRLKLSYGKRYLYSVIWDAKDIPIAEDFDSINRELIEHFEVTLKSLRERMLEQAKGLEIEDEVIDRYILMFLEPQLIASKNLKIKEKTKRRVLYHFSEYLKPLKEKKLREELLAKTIRDFKLLYPIARKLKRKITFNVGPTNSGKTWSAMQRLKSADSGYYLAPLRLLALEGYESMIADGINASLITGEEEILDEDSTHISSTIEMLNSEVEVDVCVIDEIQMIDDRDRGWAWVNALIGAPAKEVILTGSENAIEAVEEICRYLGEELEIVRFERKNPLVVMPHPTPLKKIKKGTAIVAFSRKEVLSIKQQLSHKYSISVVYGNLSPEVRREEARRFREGESEILVATDAIAMGLNLPIQTLLFSRDNKFDGVKRRELTPQEVQQIAGRAGRFGLHEEGFIGALDKGVLNTIKEKLELTPPDIKAPFTVMASLEHIMLISEILDSDKLTELLKFFSENMEFEGPFIASNIESMLEIASIVDEYDLDLKSRYHLSCAPVSLNSPYIESVFHRYLRLLEKGEKVSYIPPRKLPPYAITNEEMLNAEDRVKEVSLYLWLSFKFPDYFVDTQKAIEARYRLNSFIEKSLQKGDFGKKCRICGKKMDYTFRYDICDNCFKRGKFRKDREKR